MLSFLTRVLLLLGLFVTLGFSTAKATCITDPATVALHPGTPNYPLMLRIDITPNTGCTIKVTGVKLGNSNWGTDTPDVNVIASGEELGRYVPNLGFGCNGGYTEYTVSPQCNGGWMDFTCSETDACNGGWMDDALTGTTVMGFISIAHTGTNNTTVQASVTAIRYEIGGSEYVINYSGLVGPSETINDN